MLTFWLFWLPVVAVVVLAVLYLWGIRNSLKSLYRGKSRTFIAVDMFLTAVLFYIVGYGCVYLYRVAYVGWASWN
jgi:hypothetical protein